MEYSSPTQKPASKTTSRFWFHMHHLFLQWTKCLWTTWIHASFSVNFSTMLDYTGPIDSAFVPYLVPCAGDLVSCFASCFGGRRRVLTSWLRCSMAKLSSQDLYSSMPSAVLRTSCGLSIRQGNPRCKTDSTAVAQLLSVILPVRKRESHGHLWEISSSKHIKAK